MEKFIEKCDLCDSSFQYGQGLYNGQYLPHYKMTICKGCFEGNWDGFAPHHEKKFIEHLTKGGIALPERNEKGWFPR